MTRLPKDIGVIHFVGIGGIGMRGIAQILAAQNFKVRGSDIADSMVIRRLRDLGIEVTVGHKASSVEDAAVVVISSAIGADNPEVIAAQKAGIPVIKRAEMLAELMHLRACIGVAGSHGKSTTTSMIASLLDLGGLDPTVISGGIINAYNSTYRLGDGAWMVVETDESDGSFVSLPVRHAVVTNIDSEHMDHFGHFDNLKMAFLQFLQQIPFYGCGFLCRDDQEVQAMIGKIEGRRIFTYGFSPQSHVMAHNAGAVALGQEYEVRFKFPGRPEEDIEVFLPMFGEHNILNSLAAFSVGYNLGLSGSAMVAAMSKFAGVKRRFAMVGKVKGARIIDDYAHHPHEIEAVLKAVRQMDPRRVTAVFQPHRFTRVQSLFDDFCGCFELADRVLVSPIYAASEDPIEGTSSKALVSGITNRGHRNAQAFDSADRLPDLIADDLGAGDVVIFMGAGDITAWAEGFEQACQDKVNSQKINNRGLPARKPQNAR